MIKRFSAITSLTVICLLLTPIPSIAFEYSSLPSDNLIQNPWFRKNCDWSFEGWQTSPENSWDFSQKTQDPTDENCIVQNEPWTGTAARWAKKSSQPFFDADTNALLWQIVQANPNHTILSFHSLIVGHRVDQYKAEIYGGPSPDGPWTSVWIPFNIEKCHTTDCMNAPYNDACLPDRNCLWELVSDAYIGKFPVTKTIAQGFPYYKVEFLINYPEPNPDIQTGDVGGKLARVYFSTSGDITNPTPTPTPTPPVTDPSPTPTPIPVPSPAPNLDINQDGKVSIQDYNALLGNIGATTRNRADLDSDNDVDYADVSLFRMYFKYQLAKLRHHLLIARHLLLNTTL